MKALLLCLLTAFSLGAGHECMPLFERKFTPISTLKPGAFLLIRGNPMDSISGALLRMDTANCFEFTSKSGPNGIGKLFQSPGFGLDKYSYRVRNDSARIDWDDLIEIVELREEAEIGKPAMDSLGRAQTGIGKRAGDATIFVLGLSCAIAMTLFFIHLMSSAAFIGAK